MSSAVTLKPISYWFREQETRATYANVKQFTFLHGRHLMIHSFILQMCTEHLLCAVVALETLRVDLW